MDKTISGSSITVAIELEMVSDELLALTSSPKSD